MRKIVAGLMLVVGIVGNAFAGALNPEVSQGTINHTICVPHWTETVRPTFSWSNAYKKSLMRRQGLSLSRIHDYELDHVLPLALGGAPMDPKNLVLQPWDGPAGAHRKDRIEVKLQCLVCSGQVSLKTAQEAINKDWQAAYWRYAKEKCLRHRR